MKVLLVNGSPHKEGKTARDLQLVEAALQKAGLETEWLHIGNGPVQGCVACESCEKTNRCVFTKDICNTLIEKMIEADGVIFGSPVYFGGPSGSLCAIMDRAFYAAGDKGLHFAGKPAASVVSCWRAGGTAALARLNQYYTECQMLVVAGKYWNMTFDGEDPYGEGNMTYLGQVFADTVKRLNSGK